MGIPLELGGQRFGRLTAISVAGKIGRRNKWLCKCDCGTESIIEASSLKWGLTKSCGCLKMERITALGYSRKTHGHATGSGGNKKRSPEYRSWDSMKSRCRDVKRYNYWRYGGRGIIVCERWVNDFAAFLADMGPKPTRAHTIDRIDGDGDYEPGNCRWATPKEQAQNRRNKKMKEVA